MLRNATFSGFLQKFGEPCFRRKLIRIRNLRLILAWLSWNANSRHKYSPQKELRRYDPRSKFPQKPPFDPFSGRFTPIRPTNQR